MGFASLYPSYKQWLSLNSPISVNFDRHMSAGCFPTQRGSESHAIDR